MLTSRSTSVLVSRCICRQPFGELLALATASGWDLASWFARPGAVASAASAVPT